MISTHKANCFNFDFKLLFMIQPNQSIAELIEVLQARLENGQFIDSVHKIKLLTTLETVQRMLNGQ